MPGVLNQQHGIQNLRLAWIPLYGARQFSLLLNNS